MASESLILPCRTDIAVDDKKLQIITCSITTLLGEGFFLLETAVLPNGVGARLHAVWNSAQRSRYITCIAGRTGQDVYMYM